MKKFRISSILLTFFAIIFFSIFCVSCNFGFFWGLFGEENVDERSSSMTDLNSLKPDFSKQNLKAPKDSNHTYSFVIITDVHFGSGRTEDSDVDEDFLKWISLRFDTYKDSNPEKVPRFILNLGDTADGGHDSEYKEYLEFENKIKAIAKEKIGDNDYKIYSILGNHDLYNNGVTGFKKYCFPYISSYFFNLDSDPSDSIPGFSFYFLDTANGTLGKSQLDDFKEKTSSDPCTKIVLSHYPIYAGAEDPVAILMRIQNSMERNTILTYFSRYNVKQVYDGHIHKSFGFDFKKFREDSLDAFKNGFCAVITVNEKTQTMHTEVVEL